MQKLFYLLMMMAVATLVNAQTSIESPSYKQAIGIRVSPIGYAYDLGMLSYKRFISRRGALEVNVGVGKDFYRTDYSYRSDGKIIGIESYPPIGTLSYQLHIPMFQGMCFIIGGTGIVQVRKNYQVEETDKYPPDGSQVDNESATSYLGLGIGPVGGFDYKFKRNPINITLDHRPAFLNINRKNQGEGSLLNIALAVRYAF